MPSLPSEDPPEGLDPARCRIFRARCLFGASGSQAVPVSASSSTTAVVHRTRRQIPPAAALPLRPLRFLRRLVVARSFPIFHTHPGASAANVTFGCGAMKASAHLPTSRIAPFPMRLSFFTRRVRLTGSQGCVTTLAAAHVPPFDAKAIA